METDWLDVDTPHCVGGPVTAGEVQVAVRVGLGTHARRVAQGGSGTRALLSVCEVSLSVDSLSFPYTSFEASPWGHLFVVTYIEADFTRLYFIVV